jgi:CelD/BcsL family acetyltransferase involved in cellulose biosynthesis
LPSSLDELLGRTDAKFRSNLRRRARKLEERGEVKLTRTTEFDAGALERFLELEKAGWKGQEGTAIACDPATRRFYETIARNGAAEGWLTLYHLTAAGQDVAAHFGATWKGRYFLPKPAYHEGFKECSPGQLMVQEVLRDCIGRGLREFDFLGPMMDWKADWAPRERHHFYLYIYRKGVVGKMLHAAKFKLRKVDAERQGRGE